LALVACAPGGRGDDGSDNDDGDDAPTACTAGQPPRCTLEGYQECEDGVYVTKDACMGAQVCSVGLGGCADCDPGMPTSCQGSNVVTCNADGTAGGIVETCSEGGCSNGACSTGSECAAGDYIYLVDDENNLVRFDPREGVFSFTLIGKLTCPAGPAWPDIDPSGGTATPFSMSVDRSAKAWVLYSSGEIFNVDTTNAACTASSWSKGNGGWNLFGMGFVTETAGGSSEKLHIAGGPTDAMMLGNLGAMDPATLQVTSAGPLPTAEYSPELTGTGNAELYAYFPGQFNTYVARLDKTNSTIQQQWALPGLFAAPTAWAFAHWGGRFHVFISTDLSQQVLRLDPATGMTTTIVPNMPYRIVGAGVSTCAPVVID
jgi:hypothetical protein